MVFKWYIFWQHLSGKDAASGHIEGGLAKAFSPLPPDHEIMIQRPSACKIKKGRTAFQATIPFLPPFAAKGSKRVVTQLRAVAHHSPCLSQNREKKKEKRSRFRQKEKPGLHRREAIVTP
jgi:hypothetical protein